MLYFIPCLASADSKDSQVPINWSNEFQFHVLCRTLFLQEFISVHSFFNIGRIKYLGKYWVQVIVVL